MNSLRRLGLKLQLFLFISAALFAPAVAQTGSKNLSLLGTANRLLTGSVFTVDPGATFTVSGVLSGTPTGGTLNLSALTLTLPATVSGGTSSLQPLDAELTAISALAANGLLTRTSASTAAARTITGTAAEITITNGDGVSGNPTASLPAALTFTGKTITGGTFNSPALVTPALGTPSSGVGTNLTALNATQLTTGTVPTARLYTTAAGYAITNGAALDAFAAVATNGLLTRTAANTYAARTITGTAGQITVTNGDGVSGNPTLSLPTALTGVNSLTSAALSNLTLGTGTFGTALTFTSATGAATFAGRTLVGSATGVLGSRFEVNELSDTIAFFVRGSGQLNGVGIGSIGTNQGFINGYSNAAAVASLGIQVNGGALSIGNAGTVTTINGTTPATNPTSGALQVAGGAGFGGAIFGGSSLDINNNAFIGVRSASSGNGGNLRMRDDTGTVRWLTGLLGTAANTTFAIYDVVNAVSLFDMTSGSLATSSAIFRGTKAATLPTNGTLTIGDGSTAASNVSIGGGNIVAGAQIRSTSATGGIGYGTGAGLAQTQGTSRTTAVSINAVSGAITLFTAAGSATATSFTVNNPTVVATDVINLSVRSGTNKYLAFITAVGASSFEITFYTTGGTASDAPVINFAVIKAVSS